MTKFAELSLHSVLGSEGHRPNKSFTIGLKPFILDLTLYTCHTMNPKLASIGSSEAISITSTTFRCTLKGYFTNGLICSFKWLRVIGCKAVNQLGSSSSSFAVNCGKLSCWISEYLVRSWYSSLKSRKNTCLVSVLSSLVSSDLAGINKLLL